MILNLTKGFTHTEHSKVDSTIIKTTDRFFFVHPLKLTRPWARSIGDNVDCRRNINNLITSSVRSFRAALWLHMS